ncbi:MAG TPA: FAD-binding oxidoreductase [Firmicutes bacterium]|nr:FAD-binding oxidoreductase [Bacillota bacterium]
MRDRADVVIIGGGINGVCAAYHLCKRGVRKVIVVEKDYLAAGSTGRCGAGVRHQWGAEMNVRLAREAIAQYERADEELGYPGGIEFKQKGYLLLAYTDKQVEQFKRNVSLQKSMGIPVDFLTPEEAREIVPHLNIEGLMGATFCPKDGHINPFKATDAYARAARRLGAEIRLRTRVTGIKTRAGRVTGVVTTAGEIDAPVVINTAGPWSREVGLMAGVDIPVYPQRHQILVTEPVDPNLQGPMVMSFHHNLYCQQTPHGSFIMGIGDPDEPKNHDYGSTWQFLEEMARKICWLLPVLKGLRIVRQWAGSYENSPDAHPIICEVSELKGFYVATGFSGHGFMLAPVAGLILSQLITGEKPTLPAERLGLERFQTGELNIEPAVV